MKFTTALLAAVIAIPTFSAAAAVASPGKRVDSGEPKHHHHHAESRDRDDGDHYRRAGRRTHSHDGLRQRDDDHRRGGHRYRDDD